jgi:hypothetical protein
LSDTIRWDFEDGHQGWDHTNGQAFPFGWDVMDSGLHSTWTPPAAGDSSYWIDSDDAGSGNWLQDTALSPEIIPDASNTNWLWWGVGYDWISSGEWLEVGIKYFDGSTWTVVPLVTYTGDTGPMWDSVDVSAYNTYDRLQVYFYYDDNNIWAWYAAFDNVTINGELYVASHDVGTIAIDDPGTRVGPGVTVYPTATYHNFGNNTETFDIYFVIDSSGTPVYNETANITIDPGLDTTYTFTNPWISCTTDGFVYDVMAFTVMSGDVNPVNDTLTQQTMVSLVGDWIQCASLPSPEECQATAYDSDNDRIYSFGGTPDGGYNYTNYTYQYDPTTDTWQTMTPMPYAIDWIDASYVSGNFYIFGGFDGGSPYSYNLIYNVAGDSWSNGASMPIARMAAGQVVYNDSLIYMLGGYNGSGPSTNVQVYNVYTDSWTTGTALPTSDMMQGVAMTGDTMWLVGGYNGSAYSTLYYGVINPSSCETITWSTGSALPVPNFNNGATQLIRGGGWYLYIVGGFENASSATAHAWEYDVAADTWNALPDYPMTITRNDFLIGREGHNEIYVVGGDPDGNWTATDQVWKLPWVDPGVAEKPNQSNNTSTFGFASNFRNPVNGDAMISYVITRVSKVSLKVYDGSGRLVSTLVNDTQNPGTKTVTWNAQNLANGVYFVRLEAEGKVDNRKMILVK